MRSLWLVNLNEANAERIISDMQEAARAKGIKLVVLKAGTEGEIDAALRLLIQLQAGGLVLGADPFFNSRRDQLVSLTSRDAVPAMYNLREYATAGGLISYGTSLGAVHRQVGTWPARSPRARSLPSCQSSSRPSSSW